MAPCACRRTPMANARQCSRSTPRRCGHLRASHEPDGHFTAVLTLDTAQKWPLASVDRLEWPVGCSAGSPHREELATTASPREPGGQWVLVAVGGHCAQLATWCTSAGGRGEPDARNGLARRPGEAAALGRPARRKRAGRPGAHANRESQRPMHVQSGTRSVHAQSATCPVHAQSATRSVRRRAPTRPMHARTPTRPRSCASRDPLDARANRGPLDARAERDARGVRGQSRECSR